MPRGIKLNRGIALLVSSLGMVNVGCAGGPQPATASEAMAGQSGSGAPGKVGSSTAGAPPGACAKAVLAAAVNGSAAAA